MKPLHFSLAVVVTWALFAALSPVHADPQPALDRALVERLVRAEEAQTHALEALVRATERCRK